MIICDVKECPATATHLVYVMGNEILFCTHHLNENIAEILIQGWTVVVRPDLMVTVPATTGRFRPQEVKDVEYGDGEGAIF
jgi:hypothetical protein